MKRLLLLLMVVGLAMPLMGQETTDEEKPINATKVDQLPTFKNGDLQKFRLWVIRHVTYPYALAKKKIGGAVAVAFVVEKDGSVSNVEVIHSAHPLLDKEVVEAVQKSPKWKPGIQKGRAVRVRYILPVSFAPNVANPVRYPVQPSRQ